MTPIDRPTLCIGILTMNEERRIAQCIQSAKFADQIVVVSRFMFSRDDTLSTRMLAPDQ